MAALVGVAYGAAASSIPAPHDPHAFWPGNVCTPWVVIPFVVGRFQRSLRQAMLAGVVVTMCCVFAFYRSGFTTDAFRLGLSLGTPPWRVAMVSAVRLVVVARVWLGAGLLTGLAAGAAGWRWRDSGDRRWLLLPAGVILAEPFCWWLYEAFKPSPERVVSLEVWAMMMVMSTLAHYLGRPIARRYREARRIDRVDHQRLPEPSPEGLGRQGIDAPRPRRHSDP